MIQAGSVDYYKVLDVKRDATSAEIKTAYHKAAKKAHPDAGGNAEAMQLVNEAYSTLSSALNRREYDAHRSTSSASATAHTRSHASAHHRAGPQPNAQASTPHPRGPAPSHAGTRPQAYSFDPSLISLARQSAWRLIFYSVLISVMLAVIAPYIYANTPDATSRKIIALTAFAPMYALAAGVVFLVKPSLRIAVAQIASGHLPSRSDAQGLFALVIAAIPLADAWLIGFSSGALK